MTPLQCIANLSDDGKTILVEVTLLDGTIVKISQAAPAPVVLSVSPSSMMFVLTQNQPLPPSQFFDITVPPGQHWTTQDDIQGVDCQQTSGNGSAHIEMKPTDVMRDTTKNPVGKTTTYPIVFTSGGKQLKFNVSITIKAPVVTPPIVIPPTQPPPTGTTEPSIMDWDTYPGVTTPLQIGVVGWNVDTGALSKAEFSIDGGSWTAVQWTLNPASNVVEYSVSVPAGAKKVDFRGTDAKGNVTNLPTLPVNDSTLYTLTKGKTLSGPVADTGKLMVYDGCTLNGGGLDDATQFFVYDANPDGSIKQLRTYLLNCKIINFRQAGTNMRLVRNCTTDQVGSQGFSDSKTVINSTVTNIVGVITPQNHTDAYMTYSLSQGIILYGLTATQNLHARGIAIAEAGYRNVAIVGCKVGVLPGGASWEFGSKGGDLVENVLIKDTTIIGASTWYPNPYKNVVIQNGSGMSNVPSGVTVR